MSAHILRVIMAGIGVGLVGTALHLGFGGIFGLGLLSGVLLGAIREVALALEPTS